MSALGAIARKELAQLRVSLTPYVLLGASVALATYLFLTAVEIYPEAAKRVAGVEGAPGVTDLVVAPYLAEVAGLLLLLVPLVTMRALVDERRGTTLHLLFSAGAGDAEIVLGKYLGALGFVAIALALLALPAASLALGCALDWGKVAAGLVGLLALAATQAAIGVLASAYAGSAAAAAFACYAATGLLWYVDTAARAEGTTEALINWLALPTHLSPFLRGIVASVDLVYFVVVAALALALAARRVRALRERGA